jgi:hypothetical protein
MGASRPPPQPTSQLKAIQWKEASV